MKKTVIFDLDGLLIDSEPLWSEATKALLAKRGIAYDPKMKSKYMGFRQNEAVKLLKDAYEIEDDIKTLAQERNKLVIDLYENRLKMMPGAEKIINRLYKEQYTLAIATSSPREVLEYVLKKLGIKKYFQTIISGDDVKNGKPDPDIYLLTADKLKVNPKDCIVLEDSVNGIKAANNAGMKSIGIANKFVNKEDLKEADEIYDSLFDVNIS